MSPDDVDDDRQGQLGRPHGTQPPLVRPQPSDPQQPAPAGADASAASSAAAPGAQEQPPQLKPRGEQRRRRDPAVEPSHPVRWTNPAEVISGACDRAEDCDDAHETHNGSEAHPQGANRSVDSSSQDGSSLEGSSWDARRIRRRLLAAAPNASAPVRGAAATVAGLVEEPVTGDLAARSAIADGLTVLARTRNALDAQLARFVTVAHTRDLMPASVRTALRAQGWSGPDADAMVTAAPFAARHPALQQLWEEGRISTDTVAALARGLRGLTPEQTSDTVAALAPHLEGMPLPGVRACAARAVDLLNPVQADAKEQRDHDNRYLVGSTTNGVTVLHAKLTALEGQTILDALTALGESLRIENDGLHPGQRRADALITLVNAAAAHGDLPTTASGLPVGAMVTIGLAEAERVAAGEPRRQPQTLLDAVTFCGRPSRIGSLTNGYGTLGDAAARFTMCCGDLTGALVSAPHDPTRHAAQTASTPVHDILEFLGTTAIGEEHVAEISAALLHLAGQQSDHGLPSSSGTDVRGVAATDHHSAVGSPSTGIVAQTLANTHLEVLALGRSSRFASAAQRRALAIRDGGCVTPGCTRPPAECQTHHVIPWADGGSTDLSNLALLCWSHHRAVDLNRLVVRRNSSPHGPSWHIEARPAHHWRSRAA